MQEVKLTVQETVIAAAEAIVGKMEVEYIRRVLLAAGSKNTVADMFRAAINSKAKSEFERLSGVVLTKLHREGFEPARIAEVCRHLGIGGTRVGEQSYLSSIGAQEPKAQPTARPNGS